MFLSGDIILLDGYVDEPSAFGVPPYISFQSRYIYGAIRALGLNAKYLTIDQYRLLAENDPLKTTLYRSKLLVILAGCIVPGKYLRGTPITIEEIKQFIELYEPQMAIFGGAAAKFGFGGVGGERIKLARDTIKPFFDLVAKHDTEATVFDYLYDGTINSRRKSPKEWTIWSHLGAEVIQQHPDFPEPLMIELEASRGCPRYVNSNGGCNFCIEPLLGGVFTRDPKDIIKEVEILYNLGARNFRIGGTTDVYATFGSGIGVLENPRPNVTVWEQLLTGFWSVAPYTHVLHLDNANPAVIAQYPEESRELTKLFVKYCTDGNILPFGLESADPNVIKANNLNTNTEETLFSIRLLNELGRERGPYGLPKLLPGLNFISGLLGETKATFKYNYDFLKQILDEGLLLRRINLRQVAGMLQPFDTEKYKDLFHTYKRKIREDIDRPLLHKIAPVGTIIRRVYLEQYEGQFTHGRQVATYALLITLPYRASLNRYADIIVTGYGYRSISGIALPINLNKLDKRTLSTLPMFGPKRTTKILLNRPFKNIQQFEDNLDDPAIISNYKEYLVFEE